MRGLIWSLLVVGCGASVSPDGGSSEDGGARDAGSAVDAGDPDGGAAPDATTIDAGDLDGGVEAAGVVVAAEEPCPAGFEAEETHLYQGIIDNGCTGCACDPTDTTCTADVFIYSDDTTCAGDTGNTGGALAMQITSTACTSLPIFDGLIAGARAHFDEAQNCSVRGSATPAPPSWSQEMKYCRAAIPNSEARCTLFTGAASCDGFATSETWYTDYTESGRSCASCTCDASGGGCAGVTVGLGSDWVCTDAYTIGDDEKRCQSAFSPPARLVGSPTPPTTCSARADASGTVAPSGMVTLCCNP